MSKYIIVLETLSGRTLSEIVFEIANALNDAEKGGVSTKIIYIRRCEK